MTHGEFNNVKLTPDELDKLFDRLGVEQTQQLIENLSIYMEAKRTRYKRHFAVILMWSRMARKKGVMGRGDCLRGAGHPVICQEDGCKFDK